MFDICFVHRKISNRSRRPPRSSTSRPRTPTWCSSTRTESTPGNTGSSTKTSNCSNVRLADTGRTCLWPLIYAVVFWLSSLRFVSLRKTSVLFLVFRRLRLFKTDILQCTADELNYSLCLFVKEVRKPNGDEYAPDSIYYLCLGEVTR